MRDYLKRRKQLFKIVLRISIITIASIFACIGVGFLISSLYLYLITVLPAHVYAALICGGVFFAIAVILLLIAILIKKNRKVKIIKSEKQEKSKHSDNPYLNIIKQYPLQSSLIGLGAGFLMGFSPSIRKFIMDNAADYLNGTSLEEVLEDVEEEEESEE